MNGRTKRRVFRWISLVMLFVLPVAAALAETETEIAMHPYVDEVDGTTFMLPDGWTEDTAPEVGYSHIVSYIQRPDSNRRVIFIHGSMDQWPVLQEFATSREGLDFVMNDASIMSVNLGGADIEEVEFNGITYYRYMSQESTWQYFRTHNGYLHMFQFDVDTDDPYYAYFEAIMNSVVFPEIEE